MKHRLQDSYRPAGARDWSIDDAYVERVDQGLAAREVRVEGVMLKGALRPADQCVRVTVASYVAEQRRFREWVNPDTGESVSLSGIGQSQILSGLAMPLLVPICLAGGCSCLGDDNDCSETSAGDWGHGSVGGDVFLVGAAAGAVVGGLLIIAGLVDVAADGEAGPTDDVLSRRESETRRSAPFLCADQPALPNAVELRVGDASTRVDVAQDGDFVVPLSHVREAVAADPNAPWALIPPDGQRVPLEIPLETRYRLAGRLEQSGAAKPAEREAGSPSPEP